MPVFREWNGSAWQDVTVALDDVVANDDSRLTDARTPTTHAASHASGGADAVTVAISQVTDLGAQLTAKYSATNAPPAPANMVTIDTAQTITGHKTFREYVTIDNGYELAVSDASGGWDGLYQAYGVEGYAPASADFPAGSWGMRVYPSYWNGTASASGGMLDFRASAPSGSRRWTSNAPIYVNDDQVLTTASTIPAPANMVTTDTAQTITGAKTFTGLFAVQGDDDNYPTIVVQHANDGSRTEVSPDGLYGRASSATAAVPTKAWRLSGTATRWSAPGENVGISNDVVANLEVRTLADSNSPYWVSSAPIYEGTDRVLTTASTIPAPSNMVTTDTDQTITNYKTFTNYVTVDSGTGGATFLYGEELEINAVPAAPGNTMRSAFFTGVSRWWNGSASVGGVSVWKAESPSGAARWTSNVPIYENTNRVLTTASTLPAPANMVTTDTAQTISGAKTFSGPVEVYDTISGLTYDLATASVREFFRVADQGSGPRVTLEAMPATAASGPQTSGLSFLSERWTGSASDQDNASLEFSHDGTRWALATSTALSGFGLYDNGNRVYSAANLPPAPASMVTTDTAQTITGAKLFTVAAGEAVYVESASPGGSIMSVGGTSGNVKFEVDDAGAVAYGQLREGTNRVYSAANLPPAPSNMVTTDTDQTVSGAKTFVADEDDLQIEANGHNVFSAGWGGLDVGTGAQPDAVTPDVPASLRLQPRVFNNGSVTPYSVELRGEAPGGVPRLVSPSPLYENTDRVLTTASTIPAPSNMVTTDTDQTITGYKTFGGISAEDFYVGPATGPGGFTQLFYNTGNRSAGIYATTQDAEATGAQPEWAIYGGAFYWDVAANDGAGGNALTNGKWTFSAPAGETRWTSDVPIYENANRVYSAANLPPAPSNMVTTDTSQTITGLKAFQNASGGTAVEVYAAPTQNGPLTRWYGSDGLSVAYLSAVGAFGAKSVYDDGNRVLTTASTIPGPANMVTTDTAQTITGSKTLTAGVQTPSTVTDGNALPSAYPMGLSTVTFSSVRTAHPNWPGGSAGVVTTWRTADTAFQHAVIDAYARFRQKVSTDAWGAWYTLLDGYPWRTKGRIAVGDGDDPNVPGSLAVGADATVLTADSASVYGVKWAAPAVPPAPSNMVTTDTAQTITGDKTWLTPNGADPIRLRTTTTPAPGGSITSPNIVFYPKWHNGTSIVEQVVSLNAYVSPDGTGASLQVGGWLYAGEVFDNYNRVYSAANLPPAPSNMVTTDTDQTITGTKMFSPVANVIFRKAAPGGGTESSPVLQLTAWSGPTTSVTGSLYTQSGGAGGLARLFVSNAELLAPAIFDDNNRVYSAGNKVPTSGLSATGTAGATTFLRGDNTWAAVPAPSNMVTTDTTQTITGTKTLTRTTAGTMLFTVAGRTAPFDSNENNPATIRLTASRDSTSTVTNTTKNLDLAATLSSLGASTLTLGGETVAVTGELREQNNRVYSIGNKVPVAGLSATGTADATTFLRGDNTWAAPTAAAPANMMTTDTIQTITGDKTFVAPNASASQPVRYGASVSFQATRWNGTASAGFSSSLYGAVEADGSLARIETPNRLLAANGIYDGGTSNRVYSFNNKVPVAGLSATGTKDATTFLRGDDTWAAPTAAAPANMATTDTAQVLTGVKTFRPGTLLVSNADGSVTAEPYSDLNAPGSLEMTQAATPVNPPAGEATLWTPDSKSLLMRAPDGTTTTIGPSLGGGGNSWAGRVHVGVGNGEPEWEQQSLSIWGSSGTTANLTPTNITVSVGRLVLYRCDSAIVVNRIRWYGLNIAQTKFRMCVYNAATGAQVIAPITVDTTATAGWRSALLGSAVTLAADTPYWVAVSATATGTEAALRCAATPGAYPPLPANYPASLNGVSAAAGTATNRFHYAQIAVTNGVLPATLPSLTVASAWTGSIPLFFFDNSTAA